MTPGKGVELTVKDSDLGKDQQTYVETFDGRKHEPNKKITTWYQKMGNQKAQSNSNEMLIVMVTTEPDWNRIWVL